MEGLGSCQVILKLQLDLRIPDSYDAKIVKIYNLWTFWPVIQLISPLFKIQQKALLPNAPYIYGALDRKPFCRILKR